MIMIGAQTGPVIKGPSPDDFAAWLQISAIPQIAENPSYSLVTSAPYVNRVYSGITYNPQYTYQLLTSGRLQHLFSSRVSLEVINDSVCSNITLNNSFSGTLTRLTNGSSGLRLTGKWSYALYPLSFTTTTAESYAQFYAWASGDFKNNELALTTLMAAAPAATYPGEGGTHDGVYIATLRAYGAAGNTNSMYLANPKNRWNTSFWGYALTGVTGFTCSTSRGENTDANQNICQQRFTALYDDAESGDLAVCVGHYEPGAQGTSGRLTGMTHQYLTKANQVITMTVANSYHTVWTPTYANSDGIVESVDICMVRYTAPLPAGVERIRLGTLVQNSLKDAHGTYVAVLNQFGTVFPIRWVPYATYAAGLTVVGRSNLFSSYGSMNVVNYDSGSPKLLIKNDQLYLTALVSGPIISKWPDLLETIAAGLGVTTTFTVEQFT